MQGCSLRTKTSFSGDHLWILIASEKLFGRRLPLRFCTTYFQINVFRNIVGGKSPLRWLAWLTECQHGKRIWCHILYRIKWNICKAQIGILKPWIYQVFWDAAIYSAKPHHLFRSLFGLQWIFKHYLINITALTSFSLPIKYEWKDQAGAIQSAFKGINSRSLTKSVCLSKILKSSYLKKKRKQRKTEERDHPCLSHSSDCLMRFWETKHSPRE